MTHCAEDSQGPQTREHDVDHTHRYRKREGYIGYYAMTT